MAQQVGKPEACVHGAVNGEPGRHLAMPAVGHPFSALGADGRGQMLRHQRDCLAGERVADGLVPNGIGALDGVIQSTHPRRDP